MHPVCCTAALAFVLALVPTACEREVPAPGPVAREASHAAAPESSGDAPADTYAAVKKSFKGLVEAGDVELHAPLETAENAALFGAAGTETCVDAQACALDLHTCSSGYDFLGEDPSGQPADPTFLGVANAAYYAVWLEGALSGFGYPRSLWQPIVADYEAAALAAVQSLPPDPAPGDYPYAALDDVQAQAREALLPVLNGYREQSDPALPIVFVEGGCGAGDIGIRVATDPADGSTRFIPVFFHRLCSVQGLDPDDPQACEHWREPADGVLFDVSGDYRYHAQWPDGHTREGKFSFTNLEDGQTVTIRRQ